MKADKKEVSRLLKTARGQIDGILKMIEDDRYCIDISNQLLATDAIIKKANKAVLLAHMKHCVSDAIKDDHGDEKIEEVMEMISKLMK